MKNGNVRNRVLRMKDLTEKVGFRPSTLYQLITEGKFPAPFKLVPGGRATGWMEQDVDAWILEQKQRPDVQTRGIRYKSSSLALPPKPGPSGAVNE